LVAAAAVATPISYAPYKDPVFDGRIAFVYAEDDSIVTPEMRDSYLEKSGIQITRSIKGGHGIDQEAREDVLRIVVELAEEFRV
jgi:pimeloyl-ACP methyl ester carboxylesterase